MFPKAINPKREVFNPDGLKLYHPYAIFMDGIIFLATFVKMSDYKLWFNYFKPEDDGPHLLEININDNFDIYPLESIYDPEMFEAILNMIMIDSIDFSALTDLTDKEKGE